MTESTAQPCPNCGVGLRPYRKDRQQAGKKEVALHWMICQSCGHVALYDWGFIEEPAQQPNLIKETRSCVPHHGRK
jgi:RNase P subunit RPR2